MPKLQRLLTRRHGILSIGPSVLAELLRTAWAAHPDETGGVLLGHRRPSDGLGSTVRHVVGPGPAALHEPRRFGPDQEWQVAQVAELWTRDQSLQYLGDWHTHPSGPTTLSPLDKDALRVIAAAPEANQANPVMLIVALNAESTRVGVTVFSRGEFKSLRVAIHRGW